MAVPDSATEELLRLHYSAIDKQDYGALLALYAAECEYLRPGYAPIRGREELRDFYTAKRRVASGVHDIHDVIIAGSFAVVLGGFSGVLKDGDSASVEYCDVFHLREREILRRSTYFFVPAL